MARKRAMKKKAEPAGLPELPKDADGYIDLSGIVTPRFRFKYYKTEDDKQVEVKEERDMEWVMIQLRQNLPTAFDSSDGKTINLLRVFQLAVKNEPIPVDLPQVSNIIVAARNAMELPADMGTTEVMYLLQTFLIEWVRLEMEKKGRPDSRG